MGKKNPTINKMNREFVQYMLVEVNYRFKDTAFKLSHNTVQYGQGHFIFFKSCEQVQTEVYLNSFLMNGKIMITQVVVYKDCWLCVYVG